MKRKDLPSRSKEARKQEYVKYQEYYRNYWLKKYNITSVEYKQLLEKQNGVCAICLNPERQQNRAFLAVDHCHATGKVRGLLCSNCNRAIGLLDDSLVNIENALAYLRVNKEI